MSLILFGLLHMILLKEGCRVEIMYGILVVLAFCIVVVPIHCILLLV
jgi:hypothetical protein